MTRTGAYNNTMQSSIEAVEKRRRALLETRRQTMRVVKRALIGLALFGAAYYLGLLMKEKKDVQRRTREPFNRQSTAEEHQSSSTL